MIVEIEMEVSECNEGAKFDILKVFDVFELVLHRMFLWRGEDRSQEVDALHAAVPCESRRAPSSRRL
jgi:hypothetical protein